MKKIAETEESTSSWNRVFLLIFLAYLTGIAFRMIWVFNFCDYAPFKWNNEFIMTTHDGYKWGSVMQKALYDMHGLNKLVPGLYNGMICVLGYIAVKILPFSFETIVFYMPVVIASLVVIPLFFTGRLIGSDYIGFAAAVSGVIGWSFFNRSIPGYFDTDMFVLLFPLLLIYFLLKTIKEKNIAYSLAASLTAFYYPFFYSKGAVIANSIIICYSVYSAVFYRKEEFTLKSIGLILIGVTPFVFLPKTFIFGVNLSWLIKTCIITGVFFIIRNIKIEIRIQVVSGVVLFILFMVFLAYSGTIQIIFNKVQLYLVRDVSKTGDTLNFLPVMGTVREAQNIDFTLIARRISGSVIGLLTGVISYIFLLIRRRDFLITLPLVGIGFFSFWGGLRFTIYALPVFALSSVYLFYCLGKTFFKNKKAMMAAFSISILCLTLPNIIHTFNYLPPSCNQKANIRVIDSLKKFSKPGDFAVTWWDYGSSLWYYSGLNTLTAPSYYSNDNFAVSHILLSSSQRVAANLSRVIVENFVNRRGYRSGFEKALRTRSKRPINPNAFLTHIKSNKFKLPEKTRDVFLYLPYEMVFIINKISLFSEKDIVTGKKKHVRKLNIIKKFIQNKKFIILSNGIIIDKNNFDLKYKNGSKVPVKCVYDVYYKKGKPLIVDKYPKKGGKYNMIYHRYLKIFLVLDDAMLNSNFIQMYIFDNYSKRLFKPISLNPAAKVYMLN